jgi:hypothetical protein
VRYGQDSTPKCTVHAVFVESVIVLDGLMGRTVKNMIMQRVRMCSGADERDQRDGMDLLE